MQKSTTNILLTALVLAFAYFTLLVMNSYAIINLPDSFRFFVELLTIPLLIFVLILFFLSTYKIVRRRADIIMWVVFIISLLLLAALTVVTLLQI